MRDSKTVKEQGNVVSVSTGNPVIAYGERSIGAILVRAGRLTPENTERILCLQSEQNLSFGEAGIRLGLLTQADIEFALSLQFNYPYLLRGESKLSEDLVAAYTRSGPQLEALRALRSQLMLRWFDGADRKALAIISGERREGRSFIAANLAVVFSLLGERTLLIDADMHFPCQHALFGLENRAGLSAVLSGRGGPDLMQRIPGLLDLSVLPAGVLPPNPLELLAQPLFPKLLKELRSEFDVILLDSPASESFADAQTIAGHAGAALIVARKNVSRKWRVRGVSDSVTHESITIVGSVLNDF
jgi:chain length determinant protein tyrosine kinase EpsG